jgi:hypothetical protein
VDAVVASEVDAVDRLDGHPAGGLGADEGQDAAVVVGVGVHVEQVVACRGDQGGDDLGIATLGDVQHALEHDPRVPSRGVRGYARQPWDLSEPPN